MAIKTELVLERTRSFREICDPLASELAEYFFVLSVQAGPIDTLWVSENDELMERFWWRVPALENWAVCLLRPGAIPRLASHIRVDEWSYYYAIATTEEEATRRATALARNFDNFGAMDQFSDLLICHVDGWWEFFTASLKWQRLIRNRWPDCHERAVSQAGKPPRP